MDKTVFCVFLILLYFILGNAFYIKKRELMESPTAEGEVRCLSESMETWIHSAKGEELEAWLSETLQIKASLASLDHLNLQLSSCGFSLHKDSNKNFLFRASYSGCLVQHQHGYHVLMLNLKKRTNRFGGRSLSHILKCPVTSALLHREQIQCDPEFIQVTREVPYVNWGNELQWFLSLSNNFIVALEDASLIQMNTVLGGTNITVQGRRKEVMNPVEVWGNVEFLALKLVSGQYAYSMEAICPTVPTSIKEDTVLHILKRHMGLTKRGSHRPEALTVSSVSVHQTHRFTVQETSELVTLTIPTAQILQTKACPNRTRLLQPFYRVDVVLSFKETNQEVQWSIENTLPCTAGPAVPHGVPTSPPGPSDVPLLSQAPVGFTVEQSHGGSTAPAPTLQGWTEERMAEVSTAESLHAQLENGTSDLYTVNLSTSPAANASVVFGGDDAASINATQRTSLDFLNVTVNAEPAFFEAPTAAEPLESSAEPQYQQVTTSSGDQDHQKQLKLIW